MLGLVDGLRRIARRGPSCAGARRLLGPAREVRESRKRPLGGAQHLEAVERRHARPPLRQIDARPRQHRLAPRRAHRQPQREALLRDAAFAGLEPWKSLPLAIAQERILDHLLRKQLLGEARYEDDLERESARRGHLLDVDAAVALSGGWLRELGEPSPEDEPHLGQRHRPHRRHRGELREQRQDPRRLAQRLRRERGERIDPISPGRGLRQRREGAEERQRELAQRRQVFQLASQVLQLRLVVLDLLELPLQRAAQAGEPLLPAIAPADHRGVQQQLLPAPGSVQRARDHRRIDVGRRQRLTSRLGLRRRVSVELGVGRHPAVARRRRRRRRALDRVGHFAQGEIFGERARRQPLRGAGEQSEKGPPRRVGPQRARGEERRHAGPRERLFQQRPVLRRRAQEHRHAVEGNASLRLAPDEARDLDALAAFARRREDQHVAVERRLPAALDEEPLLHARERCLRRLGERARREAQRAREPFRVGQWCDRQHFSPQVREQLFLERRLHREVDEQRRQRQQRMVFGEQRQPEHLGAVGQPGPRQLRLVGFEQMPQIACGPSAGEPRFLKGARERPRKPRLLRHRLELPQRHRAPELVDDSRADRFHAQGRQRGHAARRQLVRSQHRREPPQCHALPPERRRHAQRRRPHGFGGRLQRGADHQSALCPARRKPVLRAQQPGLRARRCEELVHRKHPTAGV